MTLEEKVAIVTGASRGIGKAIARAFAENGASLILVATQQNGLDETVDELQNLGARVSSISGDIATRDFCIEVVKKTIEKYGALDIVVNAAGMITRSPFDILTQEEYLRVFDVNLHGPFYLCQAAIPWMVKRGGGRIINITSQMARIPHSSAAVSYEASKAGLAALTRHLAFHYAKENIFVNSIAPGSIDTDMPKNMSAQERSALENKIPMSRLGHPSEVGKCALFLASESSGYITGATIDVNGGSWMS